MIDGLDLVLRQTILAALPSLTDKIGFQPPDEAWRQRVGAGTGVWLNCALIDLREDRHRRTTDIRVDRDPPRRVLPPFLLRCHYLLSAWNSAKESPAVPAAMGEHALLGQVIAALLEAGPLTPSAVLLPVELAALPVAWREGSLDTDLLPPEGFGKIAEFWGTMGRATAWRPVAWVAVTVPVEPAPTPIDGLVTTILTSAVITSTVITGAPLTATAGAIPADHTLLTVGGVVRDVRDPANPMAVGEAMVSLTDPAGHLRARALTGDDGRFVLDSVSPGDYAASVRSTGRPVLGPVPLTLPAATSAPVELTYT